MRSILAGMADRSGMKLLIVRHAESIANVKGVLAGRIEPTGLTERGRRDAKALRPVIREFDPELVLSSPMLRCRQSAEGAGVRAFEIDDRLLEMDYGRWSGRSIKNLSRTPLWRRVQNDPVSVTFPGGENFLGAHSRIKDFLLDLIHRDVRRVAIFSHGDITRMMINLLLNRRESDFQRILIETSSHSLLSIDFKTDNELFDTTIHYLNRRESQEKKSPSRFKLGGE